MSNKIIAKEAAQSTPPKPRPQLAQEDIAKLAGALHRLRAIGEYQIKSPTAEAEARGLVEYLSSEFLTHGEELLGAWVTMRREYQPLLQSVAAVAFRVQSILSESAAAQAALAATPAPEQPANSRGGLI